MDSATQWWQFWQVAFAVAGGSFAVIAAIVAVRGFADLRDLIRILRLEQENRPPSPQD